MATPPAGWKQSDTNAPGLYTNNSLRLIDKDKVSRPISVVANDITGSYIVYEKTTFGDKPLYQIDKNSNKTLDNKRFENITIVDSKIEKDVYKLVQNTGIKDSIEALNNSKVYKHLAQVQQPPPPDRGIGTSPDNTNNQNPDGTPGSPAGDSPATFDVTSAMFQEDKGFKNSDWLKYPKDMNSTQDRIVITQRRYVATNAFSGEINVNAFSQERFKSEPTKEQLLGVVTLPMPNDISETNVTAWGEDSLSSLAALVGGAALGVAGGVGAGEFEKATKAATDAITTALNKQSGANETIKQLLTLNAAAGITKKFGININPEAFRSRITGTAINPNLELLFQGPKLRSFAFQFKMSPRNQEEARNIRYIIKFFKKGMAAKRNFQDSKAAYFLGTPNVFDINFKSGDNELRSIGKIKTCALQQCAVNYTPDGFYAAYHDSVAKGSQPIAVTMTLAFTELTPLYNDNYEDSDTVGWDKLEDGPKGESSPNLLKSARGGEVVDN